MRFATHDTEILYNDAGQFIGINLGWDFTAEHEWGIKRLEKIFGIRNNDLSLYGIDRRTVNATPNDLTLSTIIHDKEKFYVLACYVFNSMFNKNGSFNTNKAWRYFDFRSWFFDRQDVLASWDEYSFAICVKEEHKDELKMLYDALKDNNAAIFLASISENPFSNNGLYITIKDRLDKESLDSMYNYDIKQENLQKELDESGIVQILKDAHKEYFALSPAYASDNSLIIWLNPREQHLYHSGWYTINDLKQWVENKGPIVREA